VFPHPSQPAWPTAMMFPVVVEYLLTKQSGIAIQMSSLEIGEQQNVKWLNMNQMLFYVAISCQNKKTFTLQ